MANEMRWAHVDGFDVLDVQAIESRDWFFTWRGRVVVQPLGDESLIGLPPSSVIVAPGGGTPLRIRSRSKAAFRVIFENPASTALRFAARIEPPQVRRVVAPSIGELFRRAVLEPARGALPISPAIARARRYIEEHLADDFALDELATAAGAERCHLCRSFGRTFGLPPYRFRTHLRVASARELLTMGVECSAVASLVGFCDQSHLSRCFKELMGITPRAYARRERFQASSFENAA